MFKFIHTADIHLDSPLRGLSTYPGAPVERLRSATRAAFRNLVDLAIQEQVEFMIIAGDLYDGTWRDFLTGLFFVAEMVRLKQTGVRVFLLNGNHDAESEITSRLPLPDNVDVFRASRPQTFKIDTLRVALHGQSFRNREVVDNLVPGYPEPLDGWLNIGVLHTALEGNAAHATYAPCSAAELVAKGYAYWALGHVHEFAIPHRDPWIVFPGNLQGRHAREIGAKGAVLVTVDDGRIQDVERLFPDVCRWAHLSIDLTNATSFPAIVDLAGEALARAVEQQAEGRPLAVRVTLCGRTSLHGALFQGEARLVAEIQARGIDIASGEVWVEKVILGTTAPESVDATQARSESLGELGALIDEVARDPVFIERLNSELSEMLTKLPTELRMSPAEELAAIREGRVANLAAALKPTLLDWIGGTTPRA